MNNTCDRDNGYCSRGCKEKQMSGDFCAEVLIDGVIQCVPGQYGASCNKHCGTHCAPKAWSTVGHCGRSTGLCYEGCVAGWFGDHCNNTCSRNCRNNTCDRDNGYCSRGCKEKQMIGDFCTEVQSAQGVTQCVAGHYGASCELPCPPRCAMRRESDVRDCDRHTARCNRGCRTGWYGDHCNNTCNNNCIEKNCNRDTGKCYGRCLSGWYGDHCNNTCNNNCIENICNRDTGHCTLGCNGTYTAEFCTKVADKEPQVNTDLSRLIIPLVIGSAVLIIAALLIAICSRRILLHNRRQQSSSELEAMNPGPAEGSDQHATPTVVQRRPLEVDHALLNEASRKGDLANVMRILATGGADVNSIGPGGLTPMMWAAQHGHRELGEFLVFQGAEVSLVDDDGKNTLHHACAGGHVEMVEFVLSLNVVDINSRGWWGMTPVMEAASLGRKEVLEFLGNEGADVSLLDEYGNNILHRACWGGHLETVEFVLSLKKFDIEARNALGETATDLARFMTHPRVVDLMDSRGAQ
ncbi:uncharacterized protein [Haliotis cracherodii]|uniref:uncharacterized protein n=1 Tax=Haliotis cracherodii TaxID=6455 RepID=UPI0039EA708F